jgi:hypothetical protein
MAGQFKYTIKRGQRAQDVTIAAGSAVSGGGGDAVELNVDFTNMKRGELDVLIEHLRNAMRQAKFPPL